MVRPLLAVAVALCAASCNCGGYLASARPDIQVTPLSIDFGAVPSGTTTSRAVSITNIGESTLQILAVTVQNDARHAFSVSSPPAPLGVGSSTTLVVSYSAPSVEGPDGASLLIESNASSAPEVRVSLAGRTAGFFPGDSGSPDGGLPDSGTPDAGTPDAGTPDAGTPDAGNPGTCPGTPVVLNFDDLTDGPMPTGYRTHSWQPDWYVYYSIAGEYLARSGTRFITNYVQQGSISFTFAQPVCFAGAWFSLRDDRNAHVHFDMFDAQGNSRGSSATLTQVLAPTFLPAGVTNVSRVNVVFDVDFAMDDLTYVP